MFPVLFAFRTSHLHHDDDDEDNPDDDDNNLDFKDGHGDDDDGDNPDDDDGNKEDFVWCRKACDMICSI